MEVQFVNRDLIDGSIPLVFVNSKNESEIFAIPSDYPYKHSKITSPIKNANEPALNNLEYPILPRPVKTPRRTLITYSPQANEEVERKLNRPFEDILNNRIFSFLDGNTSNNNDSTFNDDIHDIANVFAEEIKKNRRHFIFARQWKRNAINNYLINYYVNKFGNKTSETMNERITSKYMSNPENNNYIQLLHKIKDEQRMNRQSAIKDWRSLDPIHFKKLNEVLMKYHDHLYKKQEHNVKLKRKTSSASRYFFEILAGAKECERKIYECVLFAEENTYGRRDFISEFQRETQMLKRRWGKLYTISVACLRRSMDRNRQVRCGPTSTPNRTNTSIPAYRNGCNYNVQAAAGNVDANMAPNNVPNQYRMQNHAENTTPVMLRRANRNNDAQTRANGSSNYTDEYPVQVYNSSRDTTIPFEVGISCSTKQGKETSTTQLTILDNDQTNEECQNDNNPSDGSITRECNGTSTSAGVVNAAQESERLNNENLNTPHYIDNITSQTCSAASFYDRDSKDVYDDGEMSNKLNSAGGVNKWIYSKMEERGELDGYHLLLRELEMLLFSGDNSVLGYTSLPQSLAWLDETDANRPSVPPSQDSFRDGTLYTSCCYVEITLMKVIQRALYTLRMSKTHDKELASFLLQQILNANNDLYELKRKLDNGRCTLYKKLKLHWAERNSKWGGFPPLKRGYRLLNMLGKGGFAEVWEVFDPITLTVQAAKLHILSHDMDAIERGNVVMRVKNEIDIHKTCRTHKHIVNMKACFEMGDNMLATILELCEDGDLDHYIKLHGPVPENLALTWTYQILDGLHYMKTLPEGRVHHCDLKPGNILKHKGNIKLADFGLSKMAAHDSTNIYWGGGGTIWYQPPECLLANVRNNQTVLLTDKIDIWAVGCILYEMLFNCYSRPFGCTGSRTSLSERVYQEAIKGVKFPQQCQISNKCKELIQKFLSVDPHERPSIEEALNYSIFLKSNMSQNII